MAQISCLKSTAPVFKTSSDLMYLVIQVVDWCFKQQTTAILGISGLLNIPQNSCA